ncbi:hypothetical protein [Neisseria yangbaofengii]|uniref:hypothetical protein n=1 Tax=Neisseria yangbaofengii TaxID=2709396 RepID=UPI0013EE10EB|nr:hypothetical protein [Neisseria yangbaofengii]
MIVHNNFDKKNFLHEIFYLQKNIENNFNVNKISSLSMDILNKYSSEFNLESRNMIMQLIAMDMGEEFELSKNECLKVIKDILNFLEVHPKG